MKLHIWSHALEIENQTTSVNELLQDIASLAGVSAGELLTMSKIDERPDPAKYQIIMDAKHTLARTVRIFAMGAIEDNLITLCELRRLISGAKLSNNQCKEKH
jgi:hypothetical protein